MDIALLRQWASTLRGSVILPADLAYDAARRVWNLAEDRRPAAIVRCGDVDDIRKAIDFVRASGAPVAVRSGGHSQAGHGTCDGGLVLDLASLRAIDVDDQRRVARVSAGARVADVLDATLARGLMTPMGGCPDVGVGGLTLGGGENFLMATCGAVVDNLVAAEVVTADGRVLRADAEENADLFWAIRGGGGNFGVVSWFEYRLRPAADVLSGQMVFPIARTRETMLRYRDLMQDIPDTLETSGGLAPLPSGPAFFVALCASGERGEAERLVDAWRAELQPESDSIKWSPYTADLVVPAAASDGTGVFLPAMTDAVVEVFAAAVAAAPPTASVVWNDFHGAVTRVPREAMAFPLRDRGFDVFVNASWETSEARQAAQAWVRQVGAALRPLGRGVYVNNLNDGESDRVAEAYGANYARLTAIKAHYDPDNLWRRNHNVRPEGPTRRT